MDWNWFYSALAQSTAAIVGIFGAFIVSFLISLRGNFNSTKNEIKSFINEIEKINDKINNLNFEWYNENYCEGYLNSISSEIFDEQNIKSPENYYDPEEFSFFETKEESIQRIKEQIDETREDLENYLADLRRAEETKRKGPLGLSSFEPPILNPKMSYLSSGIANINIGKMLVDFKSEAIDLFRDLKFQLKNSEDINQQVNEIKYTRRIINGSLIFMFFLFVTGVAYPLSFLPVSLKENIEFSDLSISTIGYYFTHLDGILVISITLIIVIAIFLLSILVNNLSFDEELIDHFEEIRLPKNQSQWYLAYYEIQTES